MVEPLPFEFDGGAVGCLLIHGWTGAPPEMRLLGEYLHECGLTVRAPLLPGHGTSPADMARTHWQDWVAHAEKSLLDLREGCELVFVAGLSMGALVAVHLAASSGGVAGLILYSPALKVADPLLPLAPLAKYFIREMPAPPDDQTDLTDPQAPSRLWHYSVRPTAAAAELYKLQRVVRRELKSIGIPAIIFCSTLDKSIHPTSARRLYDGLSSADKELVMLHNSGHCLTVDSERDVVFARTYGFIAGHSGGLL